MTAFGAYEFLPSGTRVALGDQRRADGRVHRKRKGSALSGGGEEAVRRNADGRSIRPIVRLRLDDLNGIEEVGRELGLERIEEPGSIRVGENGRIGEHSRGVLGIDADGLRAEVNIAEGDGWLIGGCGMGHGGVLRVGAVLGEVHRMHRTG